MALTFPAAYHNRNVIFLASVYCIVVVNKFFFSVLLCVCVVSCPYVIYFPAAMARYSLFVLKVPLNTKKTNKQIDTWLGVDKGESSLELNHLTYALPSSFPRRFLGIGLTYDDCRKIGWWTEIKSMCHILAFVIVRPYEWGIRPVKRYVLVCWW